MHAYKNNINQSSVDFVYENHELKEQEGGKTVIGCTSCDMRIQIEN